MVTASETHSLSDVTMQRLAQHSSTLLTPEEASDPNTVMFLVVRALRQPNRAFLRCRPAWACAVYLAPCALCWSYTHLP